MKIAIGADHGGFDYKQYLIQEIKGVQFVDVGAYEQAGEDDYPDYSIKIAEMVASGDADYGIMICRTGVGAIIAMNKVKGILAGLCEGAADVILARKKNNINCLSFGADNVTKEDAIAIVNAFIATEFEGGRHLRRVSKILAYERKED